jgi:intracellular sulfur oxidation DsrE/DsrF family protein
MKKIVIFLFMAAFAMANEDIHRVVYDLTSKNIAKFEKNILKGVSINKAYYEGNLQELEVTVIIHGGAYRFFVKNIEKTIFNKDKKLVALYPDLKKRVESMFSNYAVEFLMCKAAMKRNKLEPKDIVKFVKLIPNSTIGLIDKQNERYAYIPVRD